MGHLGILEDNFENAIGVFSQIPLVSLITQKVTSHFSGGTAAR